MNDSTSVARQAATISDVRPLLPNINTLGAQTRAASHFERKQSKQSLLGPSRTVKSKCSATTIVAGQRNVARFLCPINSMYMIVMQWPGGNGAPVASGKDAAPAAKAADSAAAAAAAPAETAPAEPKEGVAEDGADSDDEEEDDEEEADEADLGDAAADDEAGPSAPQPASAEQVPCHRGERDTAWLSA